MSEGVYVFPSHVNIQLYLFYFIAVKTFCGQAVSIKSLSFQLFILPLEELTIVSKFKSMIKTNFKSHLETVSLTNEERLSTRLVKEGKVFFFNDGETLINL